MIFRFFKLYMTNGHATKFLPWAFSLSLSCRGSSFVCVRRTMLWVAGTIWLSSFSLADESGQGLEQPFTVMTFNTGTGAGVTVAAEENLGYGKEQARISDEYYGHGLAWKAAVEAVHDFVQAISPDIVAFQEIFHCEDCASVPEEARAGFVCEDWQPGDPTVASLVLGEDYQIATCVGHSDKCLAVHKRFGRIRGCDGDFCLEGLEGFPIQGCSKGSRIGRAVIDRVDGEPITVICYHGTSGISKKDMACRVQQIEQIFVDFGDGAPGVNGKANIILGDFNTDPVRMPAFDPSAKRWNDFVGEGKRFHFVTASESNGPSSYGPFNIDHIVTDAFQGEVILPGKLSTSSNVFHFQMFDHSPIVVRMEMLVEGG